MDSSLHVVPSTLEVDYDTNLTELYRSITDQDWERAVGYCSKYPKQAATWVVRHYQPDDNDNADSEEKEIMWRFLPLHSACARQPPALVITALLKAYPDAAKCVDDQGMYALHYACGNQAARDVIRQLLVAFPQASKIADPRGMLPIHYAACWGPSSVSVIDMLLVAHRDVASTKDADGNSPLDLAFEGDYPEKDAVVAALQKWLKTSDPDGSNKKSSRATTEEEKKEDEDTLNRQRVGSPRTLQREVDRLRTDMETKERGWCEKSADIEKTWKNKFQELEEKSTTKDCDLRDLKVEFELAKKELHSTKMELKLKESELEDAQKKLRQSNEERKGLQMTLGDLMEQQQNYKKRTGNMNDRLGSLSVSLESMMEQQNTVVKAMKERNARYQETLKKRQGILAELLEMEKALEEDETNLDHSLKKQSKEMEAIAAVIAAARD